VVANPVAGSELNIVHRNDQFREIITDGFKAAVADYGFGTFSSTTPWARSLSRNLTGFFLSAFTQGTQQT
jgi:hypothetical protein